MCVVGRSAIRLGRSGRLSNHPSPGSRFRINKDLEDSVKTAFFSCDVPKFSGNFLFRFDVIKAIKVQRGVNIYS